MDGSHPWVLWLTLVALLIVSAFFSGSETGMMSLNRYRLRHQRKKSSGARRAAKLLAMPDRLIGLILIGNNAVNILAAIIANMLAIIYVGEAAAQTVPAEPAHRQALHEPASTVGNGSLAFMFCGHSIV